MSWSHSPSKSQVKSPQKSPIIPPNCPPNLVKQMEQSICYNCRQSGHWSWYCPSKSPNLNRVSPSPNQGSPVSSNTIQCRCGHGPCEIKPARCGRNFYACPIKNGVKCTNFVKWCDDPVSELDLQPPLIKYPECACKAGVCRRVKGTEVDGAFKYYFTCPIKEGHGSCGYRVWEDEIKLLDSKSIVPTQQSRQMTLHEFWEGCKKDDELGSELSKRRRTTVSSEDPSAVLEIPDKEDAGAALTVANSKRDDFPDLVVDDADFELTNSVSCETNKADAVLSLSRLSTPLRIRWRQIMFERRIFSDSSLGIFPSYNPIIVGKQTNVPDGPCNKLAIKSVGHQHTQLSTGCRTDVSGHVASSSKLQDGERKSKASSHREVILFTQQRLLLDALETLAPHEHESMKEAAETTFEILNVLGIDYKQFSDHVLDYINFASSFAEIDKSMENSLTMEDLIKLFEEEKRRFAQLQHEHVKTKALLETSKRHRQLLCEQVSNLKAMLNEKQNQLKFCELETLKVETCLGDLERTILETDIKLKERAEQVEVSRKQSEERQAMQIATQEALHKAKLDLEN
ncbi:unnamed protein product [Sphenostylis stenocarpa]|uniref:CCHC-type domain-containing protein n=1 Tax=Sphenostylis stenocarpa TaxID=92480 RepID=A0AA86RYM8_9FABA|nr:unnamed protein product [Sphenostylis stenocarpa]